MSFRTKAIGVGAGIAIGVSGYVFSQRSLDNLAEVHPSLYELAECALNRTEVDFVVIDGMRTAAEHQRNLLHGVSWIRRSKHQDGLAIDFAAYVDGKVTFEPRYYEKIGAAFKACSVDMNIPIVWGGDWRMRDYGHIELKYNPNAEAGA